MKIFTSIFLSLLFVLANVSSCKKLKKTDAEIEREKWIESFTDSIDFYKEKSISAEQQLEEINSSISSLMQDFEYVKNPREVTGYYIMKGWQKKIPFTTTAIYARINDNEKLELIATLAGATFNRIAVTENGENYYSEIVPHDQAFNFRHQRFNTVYFSGGKADTIAWRIADHYNDKISLDFIEGGKKNSFNIPSDEKNMIHQTWLLYNAKIRAAALQKELWICSKKIDAFRRIMEAQEVKSNLNEK